MVLCLHTPHHTTTLTVHIHTGVRIAAAMIIPFLVIAARESPLFGPEYATEQWRLFVDLLMTSIREEPEGEVALLVIGSIYLSVCFAIDSSLN